MIAGRYEQLGPYEVKDTSWSAFNEALKRRGSLLMLFDPQMDWVPSSSGERSRQQHFSDAAI